MSDVTDVIVARRNQPERFNQMIIWSVAVHAAIVALLVIGPIDFGRQAEPPRTVMNISLAGAPGPRQGTTPMAGRAVPTPPPQPAPPRPAPPRPQENAAPTRTPAPRPQPQPAPQEPPQTGATRTDTGARGQGFGLATGGSGGSGVQLDVADFCCPEYLEQMVALIQQNWQPNQGTAGMAQMKFTITRAGVIEQVQVEKTSGFLALDLAARRALEITRLPPLPAQFQYPNLPVHIQFVYQR